MPIRALPSHVVDQIAAGEVVERPAHLVKELVENALDAGARSIEVEFDHGGRRLRVTDDGKGIPEGELALALARHATSKIAESADLWRLSTFGFRGEALASAAAVSRLSLLSRPAGASGAARIGSEFGAVSVAQGAAGNAGTTVAVEELFANIPARLKFLKSDAAEHSQIKIVLKALALAHPSVEFRARSRGKLELAFPQAGSALERARQVLGAKALYESEAEAGGVRARAVFAGPSEVCGQSRGIWLFAQGRWVRDRGLQAAVIDAYRGLLMHGEFPIAAIDARVDPGEIDVNIHPAKAQVKFRDPQAAFRAVHRAVREGLEKAPWLAAVGAGEMTGDFARETGGGGARPRERGPNAAAQGSVAATAAARPGVAEAMRAYSSCGMAFDGPGFDEVRFKQSSFVRQATAPAPANDGSKAAAAAAGAVAAPAALGAGAAMSANERAAPAASEDASPGANDSVALGLNATPAATAGPWSRLQVLGQARLTYILAQSAEALVLVDQHAAHERVAYERLMRGWQGGAVDRQQLLIPLSIALDAEGAEALASARDGLERLGVALDQTGPQSVAIRARPAAIADAALARALTRLAREIAEKGGGFALERRIGDLCASMACHSVVRAGQALSPLQMQSLLAQMDEFPLSSFCPHGRPVSVEYPFARLERDFGRIV